MRSVGDRARSGALAVRVAAGIPFLPSRDQAVEDDDQLAHAGNERNLRRFSPGNQAVIEGLEHRVVLGGCAETGHVDAFRTQRRPPLMWRSPRRWPLSSS